MSFSGGVGGGGFATDEVFVPTSAEVTESILASIGGPGYAASASAGIFGQVGLDARIFGVAPGSSLFAEVLVASDEFVNPLGVPAAVGADDTACAGGRARPGRRRGPMPVDPDVRGG